MNTLKSVCIDTILLNAWKKRLKNTKKKKDRKIPVDPRMKNIFERNFLYSGIRPSNLTRMAKPSDATNRW